MATVTSYVANHTCTHQTSKVKLLSISQVDAIKRLTTLAEMDPDERKRLSLICFPNVFKLFLYQPRHLQACKQAEGGTSSKNAEQELAPWASSLRCTLLIMYVYVASLHLLTSSSCLFNSCLAVQFCSLFMFSITVLIVALIPASAMVSVAHQTHIF